MITSTLTRTELHRVTPSDKCNDNVPRCLTPSHTKSRRDTPSHTESHRVRYVMITSTLTRTELHRVTPSEKCNDNFHIESPQVTPSHTVSEM